jgi:hypothetical protein
MTLNDAVFRQNVLVEVPVEYQSVVNDASVMYSQRQQLELVPYRNG